MDRIDVLMSTFNGARHIGEQIGSLLTQTYPHWRLLVRDDGSNDHTVDIVESYRTRFPDRIEMAKDSGENIGPCKSFERLLTMSSSPYVMFCDQDDVWLSEKILLSLQGMKAAEQKFGGPILIFSDLQIVDQDLNIIHNSYFKHMNISNNFIKNPYYIVHNCPVTGCTVMLNSPAKRLCIPFGKNAIMHDWWCAVICGFGGKIVSISDSTILYRQHAGSVFGAPVKPDKTFPMPIYLLRFVLRILFDIGSIRRSFENHRRIICQGLEAGRKVGYKFKIIRYFTELFLRKYWLPFLGTFFPSFNGETWRSP
jgi:glycosyltransferase involved in cell wall biosynthesis